MTYTLRLRPLAPRPGGPDEVLRLRAILKILLRNWQFRLQCFDYFAESDRPRHRKNPDFRPDAKQRQLSPASISEPEVRLQEVSSHG